ncbi:16S rRNA (cytosine(1402)-N(4))-methyltransferase RsmH [Actinomycetaceae bacterium TAE3-ERU4]|nr:16S rRNA (cytosine(1402)-N(4))-methyltransferase RsmH [Actinomycetaceae bacterium TAE3-ERU4]
MGKEAQEAHIPVLRDRCVALLAPALQAPGALLVDCTLGMGGHSEAVLEALPECCVLGIDRDEQAIEMAGRRLAKFGNRFRAVHATYDEIERVLAGNKADAVLMDLGVSSLQLDEAERGFAYAQDADLDMRMDRSTTLTAAEYLAAVSQTELARVLRKYGEEKFASKIAANIVATREKSPLTRTSQLVDLVRQSLPQAAMRKGGNPAKRTFQAIRIVVNGELEILENALPAAFSALRIGGHLVVEAYQSLEDRMVKQFMNELSTAKAPVDLPVVPPSAQPCATLLTRGAEKATKEELESNPRSASVRLRALKKVKEFPTPSNYPRSKK